jgi:hypothetical protein
VTVRGASEVWCNYSWQGLVCRRLTCSIPREKSETKMQSRNNGAREMQRKKQRKCYETQDGGGVRANKCSIAVLRRSAPNRRYAGLSMARVAYRSERPNLERIRSG